MALAAPQNLSADVLSATQLLLTWDEVPNATTHRVYKNGAIVDIAAGSWVDDSFDPNAVTTYEIRAIRIFFDEDQVEPEPTTEVGPAATLTIGDEPGETDPADVPTTLTVPQAFTVSQTAVGEATLTWELLTVATHIDVSIDGSLTRIPADVSYTDTGIADGTTRTYRVRAVNTNETPEKTSDFTSAVQITIVALGVPDPNVTVQSSTRIFVDWAGIPGATAYDAEIDGTVVNLTDFTGFVDAGLAPLTTRTYRVRALSNGTAGEWSAEVTGTTNRTAPLVIMGVPYRLTYFPSDSHITAKALEAEFNNILALAAGGTLTESSAEPTDPLPDGAPQPGDPVPVPDAEIPKITGLSAVWDATGLFATWDAVPAFTTVEQTYTEVQGARPGDPFARIFIRTGVVTEADIDGYADSRDFNLRARVVTAAIRDGGGLALIDTGPWSDTFTLAAVEIPASPTMPPVTDLSVTWSSPSTGEITASWTDVAIPSSGQYQLELRVADGAVDEVVLAADGTTSTVFASKNIELNYEVRIRTIEGTEDSPGAVSTWSAWVFLASTTLPDAPPEIPRVRNVEATWTDVAAKEATVTWDDIDFPAGVTGQYQIEVRKSNFPEPGTTVVLNATANDGATSKVLVLPNTYTSHLVRVRGIEGAPDAPTLVGPWSLSWSTGAATRPPPAADVVKRLTGTTAAGLNHALPIPTETLDGDVVVITALLAFDDLRTVTEEAAVVGAPAGWTVLAPTPDSLTAFGSNPEGWPIAVASQQISGAVPASVTITTPSRCVVGFHIRTLRFRDPISHVLQGQALQRTNRFLSTTQRGLDSVSFTNLPTITDAPERTTIQMGAFEMLPGTTLTNSGTSTLLRQGMLTTVTNVSDKAQLVSFDVPLFTTALSSNTYTFTPEEFAHPSNPDFNTIHYGAATFAVG